MESVAPILSQFYYDNMETTPNNFIPPLPPKRFRL